MRSILGVFILTTAILSSCGPAASEESKTISPEKPAEAREELKADFLVLQEKYREQYPGASYSTGGIRANFGTGWRQVPTPSDVFGAWNADGNRNVNIVAVESAKAGETDITRLSIAGITVLKEMPADGKYLTGWILSKSGTTYASKQLRCGKLAAAVTVTAKKPTDRLLEPFDSVTCVE